MAFLAPLFFAALAHVRHPDIDPPDATRAQASRRVSVADVSREDSVSIGAAAQNSRLAAAGHAARGDSPDCAGVCAAVLRSSHHRPGECLGPARGRHPARSLVQHGIRRPLGARAGCRPPGRAGVDGNRSRHAHSFWHECPGRSTRHRGSLTRDGRDRRREAQRRGHAIRAGTEARTTRARRLDAADARSRHDQRFPA